MLLTLVFIISTGAYLSVTSQCVSTEAVGKQQASLLGETGEEICFESNIVSLSACLPLLHIWSPQHISMQSGTASKECVDIPGGELHSHHHDVKLTEITLFWYGDESQFGSRAGALEVLEVEC